jgi:hypothetical protein
MKKPGYDDTTLRLKWSVASGAEAWIHLTRQVALEFTANDKSTSHTTSLQEKFATTHIHPIFGHGSPLQRHITWQTPLLTGLHSL